MENLAVSIKKFSFSYGEFQALKNINLDIESLKITSLIGPSGCGKSTLLKCMNRINERSGGVSHHGSIKIFGADIYSPESSLPEIRKNVGMVFQKPNPFPKSIYDNVAYGLTVRGIKKKSYMDDKVEDSLKKAGLWKEVSDRLHSTASSLSGGQQQRLCIARALAVEPEILLLDEPTSALDPISTAHIEELLGELKKTVTILMVTHNLHQAGRASDYTAFMYLGDLVEFGESTQVFTNPKQERTENYITGRFG